MQPQPIDAADFARRLERLGPWPARPSVAVAVSGGRDSLALTLLVRDWIAERRGRLLALTVDHGLRAGSAEEADWVAGLCHRNGIEHRRLVWRHERAPVPGAPVQAAARDARYRLLQEACGEAGIAVLMTAHQRDDQRETFLLRLAAGSGLQGLAAMPARRALPHALVLRPLLDVPRDRLADTLRQRGQTWLDDPSNDDSRHRRVALRKAAPRLRAAGLTERRLDGAGGLFGRLRVQQERLSARLLAQAVAWHPAGFARVHADVLHAPIVVARQALSEVVRGLGGGPDLPGGSAMDRALERLRGTGRGFTVGGVRFLRRRDGWHAFPEASVLPRLALRPGARQRWGGFQVDVDAAAPADLALQPLSQALWPALSPALGPAPMPGPILWVQPAVHDGDGLLAVPTLGWRRGEGAIPLALRFIPEAPVGAFGFTVACDERHII